LLTIADSAKGLINAVDTSLHGCRYAKMFIHLDLQTGLEHLFGELAQQPVRANQIHTVSAGLIPQLLRNRRINLRRQLQLGTIFLPFFGATTATSLFVIV